MLPRIQARAVTLVAALAVLAAPLTPAADQKPDFAAVDAIIQKAISDNLIPGAVVVVGHDGKIVYRKALGNRAVSPRREPMTLDTIFDIASMTKTFTAVCVMRMVELGQVRLNDPVARYLPEFAGQGKQDITVRQLLTHYSGLEPDLDLKQPWQGKELALRMAFTAQPLAPPGARFIYSDINGIVLGALVERVSGMPLEKYMEAQVTGPLGLANTRFLPPAEWKPRIAPADYAEKVLGEGTRILHLRGTVNDPTARRMGGVAGHAGLFSTADDLAKYAQWLLDRDRLLAPATIEKMTTAQQPPEQTELRGLGWDVGSSFANNRGELLPVGGFGHTGWTGTSLWVDPLTRTYIIILSNATHPSGMPERGVISLRARVANAVAAALSLKVSKEDQLRLANITGYSERMAGVRTLMERNGEVKAGIDVLEATDFAALRAGRALTRVGLLTNQTGVDSAGKRTIDVLARAPGVKLAALFSPEHGALGNVDTVNIGNTTEAATGVPIYSAYGATAKERQPAQEVLRELDAVVVDLQDAGARFYTYEESLGRFLEGAAQAGVAIVVLDRPNPVTGAFLSGPMSNGSGKPFGNYHPLPVRHGMTMGELAQLFNQERHIGARLTVVPMQGWWRGDWYDATGLAWIGPSPNLRSVAETTLYPGVALVEGTNVSVGRGTDTPFELVGAPWVNGRELARYLNARLISGVRFVPVRFTPKDNKYTAQACQGVNLIVTDRNHLDSPALGIELASALLKLYPQDYKIERMIDILANQATFDAIVAGTDPRRIAEDWRDDIERFEKVRGKYLLYR
ncbi:MAG TPA: serine hydrolase [Terriglobales bacterium]|nr:serine hydrolase [Terriglobales bacterium]